MQPIKHKKTNSRPNRAVWTVFVNCAHWRGSTLAIYKTDLIIFPLNFQTITITLDVVKWRWGGRKQTEKKPCHHVIYDNLLKTNWSAENQKKSYVNVLCKPCITRPHTAPHTTTDRQISLRRYTATTNCPHKMATTAYTAQLASMCDYYGRQSSSGRGGAWPASFGTGRNDITL